MIHDIIYTKCNNLGIYECNVHTFPEKRHCQIWRIALQSMKIKTENTDDEWWKEILNDEGKYWENWLVFLGNDSPNMLSILKK